MHRPNRPLRRATALLLASVLALVASGCATCALWDAQRERTLIHLPDDEHGEPRPLVESEFVNNVGALLLSPFAILFDILAFPVQVYVGYRPYGDKR
jgi:hypothetical protein